MKRLLANFMTLENNLTIDNEMAVNRIHKEDDRLNMSNVILYNGNCTFGGVYRVAKSADDDITEPIGRDDLFAVELYSFEIYDSQIFKYMSFVGAIATKIEFKDAEGKKIPFTLNHNGEYAEVYDRLGEGESIRMANELKPFVSVKEVGLKYIAPSFQSTEQTIGLYA